MMQPDVIVVRAANEGDAALAASVSTVPVINGGDGSGQHPTQALLDVFTIQERFGRISGLTIAVGGDLHNGRTVRSLIYLLGKYKDVSFIFVSPPEFGIRSDIKQYLDELGVKYRETADLASAFRFADVVYWTRLQTERLTEQQQAVLVAKPELFKAFTVTGGHMARLKNTSSILMHPMPITGEIKTEEVDDHPQAWYWEQVANGMYVRMALLEWVLELD
jgi:aspartate carbamoyltransferase catalytic subunit